MNRELREIRIHYRRLPDRITLYRQHLVHEDGRVKVTLARNLPFDPPLRILGEVALERGSDAVWFTFPGAWHDIGRFHRADGRFTGIYANVLVPCTFDAGGDWETTDLFLDLWIPASVWTERGQRGQGIRPHLLDEAEFTAAARSGGLPRRWAEAARTEASRLLSEAGRGAWPPPIVEAWTLDQARARARSIGAGGSE